MFVHLPQNLEQLDRSKISSMLDDILDLFKKKPGCEEWTNKLLAELKASTGIDAGNIRDIIEAFRKEGNIYSDGSINGTGGGAAGGAFGHNPRVDFTFGSTRENTAVTLLHEILHIAGGRYSGGTRTQHYSDKAMTAAWHKLGVIMSPEEYRRSYPDFVDKYRKESNGADYVNSRLAGAAQRIVCLDSRPLVRTLP